MKTNKPQATWMDTYAQRTGHYSEEQEKKLVKFKERFSALLQINEKRSTQ